jgi:hypothetical protein
LIADAHGDLFGTTAYGGPYAAFGTAFEIAKTGPTTLVNFNGANGSNPFSGLIADAHGDLFGTTVGGGALPRPASRHSSTSRPCRSCGDPRSAARRAKFSRSARW